MKSWIIFSALLFLNVLLTLSIYYLFIDDELYFQSFENQVAISRINQMLELSRKWQWVGYVMLPIIILLRVFFTSMFLYIGVFFTELKIEFRRIFKVALLSDFVFVFAAFTKFVTLIFFKEVSTLDDLQFQPLSVLELLDKNVVDPLFVYPLSVLNVFELGYFFVLAWLFNAVLNQAKEERPIHFGKSLQLVTVFYGSGLLLWVMLVMFLTLNMS